MPSNHPKRDSERELADLVNMLGTKVPKIFLHDPNETVTVGYDFRIQPGERVPYDAESWLTDGTKSYGTNPDYLAYNGWGARGGNIAGGTYAVKIFGGDGYNSVWQIHLWPDFKAESLQDIITLYDGNMGSPRRQTAPAGAAN